MSEYIAKDVLLKELERRTDELYNLLPDASKVEEGSISIAEASVTGKYVAYESFEHFVNNTESQLIDFQTLGELSRHLLAIKDHLEDARLSDEEIKVLEKIGYPERFK